MNLLVYKIIMMELLEILNGIGRAKYHDNIDFYVRDEEELDIVLYSWLVLFSKKQTYKEYLADFGKIVKVSISQ
jgi:hypothetical protein